MAEHGIRALALAAAVLAGGALASIGMLANGTARAASVFEPRSFTSPGHEERYHTLIDELRCLVCQNQTIADSNADLASDLRREVYRMVEEGRSAEEVAGFMVARYGNFVLYRPPLQGGTVLLWAGPFLLATLGLAALAVHLRRRRRVPVDPLDEDTRERLRRIIGAGDRERGASHRPPVGIREIEDPARLSGMNRRPSP